MKKTFEEINATMKELAEYTKMQTELEAQIDALRDEIKEFMTEQGIDEVIGTNGEKATWRDVISNRFATTEFKKIHADLYAAFTKKTTSKRFTFNA